MSALDLPTWLQLCRNTQGYDGIRGSDGRSTFTVEQLHERAARTLTAFRPSTQDAADAVEHLLANGQLERHRGALSLSASAISPFR